jgi:hypothetical protein
MFFFEKKNQKTFAASPTAGMRSEPKKVFCFFSSEKKILSY